MSRTTNGRFPTMLTDAMTEKARALGVPRYTYRDLERDSGVHFTYAHKAVRYGRVPSPEIIRAWSRALAPHLPLDEALMAAGYLPDDPRKVNLVRTLFRLSTGALTDLEHRVSEAVGERFGGIGLESAEHERHKCEEGCATEHPGDEGGDEPPANRARHHPV